MIRYQRESAWAVAFPKGTPGSFHVKLAVINGMQIMKVRNWLFKYKIRPVQFCNVDIANKFENEHELFLKPVGVASKCFKCMQLKYLCYFYATNMP